MLQPKGPACNPSHPRLSPHVHASQLVEVLELLTTYCSLLYLLPTTLLTTHYSLRTTHSLLQVVDVVELLVAWLHAAHFLTADRVRAAG